MSRKLKIFLILLCTSWAAAIKSGTSEHIDRRPLILGTDILPQEWRRNETLGFSPIMVTIAPLFGPQFENMGPERGVVSVKNYSVDYNDTDRVAHIREELSDGVIRMKHVAKRSNEEPPKIEQLKDHLVKEKLKPFMLNMTDSNLESKSEVKSWPMSQQPFVKRIFANLADPLI